MKFGSRPLNKRVKTKGEDQESNMNKKKNIACSLGAAPSTRELRPKGKMKRTTGRRRRLLEVWEPPPQQERNRGPELPRSERSSFSQGRRDPEQQDL